MPGSHRSSGWQSQAERSTRGSIGGRGFRQAFPVGVKDKSGVEEMKRSLWLGSLAVALVCASGVMSETAAAQPPGGGRGGFGGPGGGFGNNPMFLLMNEKVREELEIVDDQMAELETLREDMQNEMREMFDGMRDASPEERREMMEEIRGEMEEKTKEYEGKLNKVLLPHQQTRLKQLFFQSQSRGRAGGALLSSDALKEELDITPEQEDKLREAAEKAQEEMRAEVMKLQKAAEDKIIKVLSEEQQAKYRELIGETFDFGPQQGMGRGQGGPGGGRGGQGGDRGRSDF